jgi:hypothetical protein
VPRHDDAPTRTAVVTLRRARVTLRPPPHRRAEPLPAPTVTAVWVHEAAPPEGTDFPPRMETTLPVEDLAAADTVVRYDTYRWRIARYPDALKSGCPIEDLPLEPFDRLDGVGGVSHRPLAPAVVDLPRSRAARGPLSHRFASRRVGDLVCRPHPPPGSAARADGSAHRRALDCATGRLFRATRRWRARGQNPLARVSAPRRSHGPVGDLAPSGITRSRTTPSAASDHPASGSGAAVAFPAVRIPTLRALRAPSLLSRPSGSALRGHPRVSHLPLFWRSSSPMQSSKWLTFALIQARGGFPGSLSRRWQGGLRRQR